MTRERAEEIRKAIWAAHGWAQVNVSHTPEEEEEIQRFWTTLPGSTSFYEAVSLMARGEHLKEKGDDPA